MGTIHAMLQWTWQRLSWGHIPEVVLALGLIFFFCYPVDNQNFHRTTYLNYVSAHGFAVAQHLSPDEGFLMYNRKNVERDGTISYWPYNRFCITPFALIRFVSAPFDGKIAAQIVASRLLMRLFLVLAALYAWLALVRLFGKKEASTVAVLLALSSATLLHFSEMVFNDLPALFGMTLLFHGMVVYEQEERFRQLALKSAIALLMAWQCYAVLMPYTIIRIALRFRELRSPKALLHPLAALAVGMVLLGVLILVVNFAQEAAAMGKPLFELPSVQSMLYRVGLADNPRYDIDKHYVAWPFFLKQELHRMGEMGTPEWWLRLRNEWLVADGTFYRWFGPAAHSILYGWKCLLGVAGFAIGSLALKGTKQKTALLAFLLSGVVWSFPMRHFVAIHPFQAMFYFSVPLLAYTVISDRIESRFPRIGRLLLPMALVTVLCSVIQVHAATAGAADFGKWNRLTEDAQAIYDMTQDNCVVFLDIAPREVLQSEHAPAAYLPHCMFTLYPERATFVVTEHRPAEADNLTPANRLLFLTMAKSFEKAAEASVADGEQEPKENTE